MSDMSVPPSHFIALFDSILEMRPGQSSRLQAPSTSSNEQASHKKRPPWWPVEVALTGLIKPRRLAVGEDLFS